MATEITTKRHGFGYLVYSEGRHIGQARRSLKKGHGFHVFIDGVYWRNLSPSGYGATSLKVKKLSEVASVAEDALAYLAGVERERLEAEAARLDPTIEKTETVKYVVEYQIKYMDPRGLQATKQEIRMALLPMDLVVSVEGNRACEASVSSVTEW